MKNKQKKICVITTTRAEYGLLYWLIKEIQKSDKFKLQLVVGGTHLLEEYGKTINDIEFKIDKKIDFLLDDSKVGISKSMGVLQLSISETFEELQPDFVVVLGDRFELIPIVSSAVIFNIPVVHLHGGEITEGAVDEYFRHAITKMSYLHFASTKEYKNNIIQMGENPNRVFYLGAMGIENIYRLKLLNKKELQKSLNFQFGKKNILVTYHPETLSQINNFEEVLKALKTLKDTKIIFTKANSDTNGKIINKMIEKFVIENKNAKLYSSLGQLRYLSTLQFVDIVLGNSSSGLLEVPSFKKATINIGDRQKGRIKAISVIDVKANKKEILKAIKLAYSKKLKKKLKNVKNPYEKSKYPSRKILKVLENIKVNIRKSFYKGNK